MPHVIVKMYPGRSEDQKARLVAIAGVGDESVSVAIEDVNPGDWADKVYQPDILNGPGKLYKKPGYNALGISPT
jgi:4-oxalocrotonate tautomerase